MRLYQSEKSHLVSIFLLQTPDIDVDVDVDVDGSAYRLSNLILPVQAPTEEISDKTTYLAYSVECY
jgi:hypothetical protein